MKKITGIEFCCMIFKNPSIFEHWNTPLEIIEYVDCRSSKITHLSPHLTFSGKSETGESADFSFCDKLTIATGNFHGFVWFANSGIEKIENLHIKNPNEKGWAASFWGCPNLKIATGNYPGLVLFSSSGVEAIQNLHIEKPNIDGNYAAFTECSNLQNLEGWDIAKKIHIEPKKLEAEIKRRASWKTFIETTNPSPLPFL
jgi:hypothetical protein